jgi:glycosyltransferase involved in cell wall biosynthesis
MAQLLTALADRHRVALLYLRGADEPPVDDGLRARCELVQEVGRDFGSTFTQRWLQRARIIRSLLSGNPRWVAQWAVRSCGARVSMLAQSWQPDIVQIEYHVMGQYAPALSGCAAPRVLIQHDPGAVAARDRRQLQRGLPKLLSHLEMRAWERYERAIMREVQAIVVFTDRDRQALAPLVRRVPIVRIPIGTVLPERPLDPLGRPPLSIGFVGSFIHPPNTDAAVRLMGAIFPRVRTQFPELVLYLVGDDPPASVREMAGENVFVTGRVPDTSPYLDRAALVVVPLRLGGGMRVKVLEALAAGKAVVASPLAVEGLDLSDGEQVVLAETDQQFCDAIGGLLCDPERRFALARRARAWACANLGWESSVAAYEALYTSLITG